MTSEIGLEGNSICLDTPDNDVQNLSNICIQSKTAFTLILHFDVNGTIIANDKAAGLSIADRINFILASKYTYCYGDLKEPLSYSDYVSKLYPGDFFEREVKSKRELLLKNFVNFVKESDFPFKQDLMIEYSRLETALNGCCVFPSFISLIKQLKDDQINFKMVLRTFGNEVEDAISDIESHLPDEKFTYRGSFKDNQWTIQNGQNQTTIEKINEIYDLFKSDGGHIAIQDSFKEWFDTKQSWMNGKRFPINLQEIKQESPVLSLFFDDFIGNLGKDKDIITPINSEDGSFITIQELQDRKIVFSVKTGEAILDPDYFINKVYGSLENYGFIKTNL